MPKAYMKIKASVKKEHPKMPMMDVKEMAARIFISQGKTKAQRSSRARSLKHG